MVIYTGKGDKGETSVFAENFGKKVIISKDSLKIKALGAIDELTSFLGVTVSFCGLCEISSYLKEIQKDLLTIGSITAGSKLKLNSLRIKKIEKIIDRKEKTLPPLKNFIIPGGTVCTSQLHFARSLARKTERVMVSLSQKEKIAVEVLIYLNRLSDFLFILARYANFESKVREEVWPGGKE